MKIVTLDFRLSDKAKLVFARLVDRFNVQRGCCYPSERLLADELGCTDRTVRTAVRLLERTSYVQLRRNGGPNGSNLYHVWIPSGKSEYEEAEKALARMRKDISAKTLKETSQETKKRDQSRFEPTRPPIQRACPVAEKRRTREAIEKAFVRTQEDTETGYERLQQLGDDRLSRIAEKIDKEGGTIKDALKMVHEAFDDTRRDE